MYCFADASCKSRIVSKLIFPHIKKPQTELRFNKKIGHRFFGSKKREKKTNPTFFRQNFREPKLRKSLKDSRSATKKSSSTIKSFSVLGLQKNCKAGSNQLASEVESSHTQALLYLPWRSWKRWAIPGIFFVNLIFSNVQLVNKTLPKYGIEPKIWGVVRDRSTNWATTTALPWRS